MRVPSRCNRRGCQARRNLRKAPEKYVRWPVCHVKGCGGRMYVDKYRLRRGAYDVAPKCVDSSCMWLENRMRSGGTYVPMHSVGHKGCAGNEEYRAGQALRAKKQTPESSAEPMF